jgi:pimeloyl-ACP methyl ester carboxylesterase
MLWGIAFVEKEGGMPTLTANNCEMFYQIDDFTDPWRTDTETVWLQHGVGRSTKFWYHWVPSLAGQYRVIRRDMRGHGQSADPGPDHTWSLDELVTDMHDFMDALGLGQVHYVGESIGGILGVLFATRWPERLKSLTICNSPTTIRPSGTQALSGQHGNVNQTLARDGSKGWGRLLIEQKIISGKNPAHTDWVVNEWAKTPTHVLQGITRTLDGADTAPLLPQVSVPTLILAPAHSPITPLADQLSMRTGIPNARITVVEGPGHEIYVDEPQQCLQAVQNFLGSLC